MGQQASDNVGTNSAIPDPAQPQTAWSFWLVFSAIGWVTAAFLIVMLVYSRLEVFDKNNVANITAALSSLFGIVGTLVGAYFGIKATTDAQGKVENSHSQALATNRQTTAGAQQATAAAAKQATDSVREAMSQQTNIAKEVAAATSSTGETQGASKAGSAASKIVTLAPLAGTAGLLLITLRYLRRLEKLM
jgi:multidrug efflux pump subunit AcrA (membrane-fusion protein)